MVSMRRGRECGTEGERQRENGRSRKSRNSMIRERALLMLYMFASKVCEGKSDAENRK